MYIYIDIYIYIYICICIYGCIQRRLCHGPCHGGCIESVKQIGCMKRSECPHGWPPDLAVMSFGLVVLDVIPRGIHLSSSL